MFSDVVLCEHCVNDVVKFKPLFSDVVIFEHCFSGVVIFEHYLVMWSNLNIAVENIYNIIVVVVALKY